MDRIRRHLQARSAGVYALGRTVDGVFITEGIGRSDEDLRAALEKHISGPHKNFKFAYAVSYRDAFEKECDLYHSLEDRTGVTHPAPPLNSELKCAWCRYVMREAAD